MPILGPCQGTPGVKWGLRPKILHLAAQTGDNALNEQMEAIRSDLDGFRQTQQDWILDPGEPELGSSKSGLGALGAEIFEDFFRRPAG